MNSNIKVAFFDIDGTLVAGNSWNGIVRYPEVSRLKVARHLALTAPRLVSHKLYFLGHSRYMAGRMIGLAKLFRNWDRARVDRLFAWLADEYLLDAYRADVLNLLEQQKLSGIHTVLLTMNFKGAAEAIARRLGAAGAIGTALEFHDGDATGKPGGHVCVGLRRLDFVRLYLQSYDPSIPLSECAVYADSYEDAPLLAAAGKGVAVYPDRELQAAATEQGWDIHRFPPIKKRRSESSAS